MVAPTKRPTEAWHTAGLFERGFGQVIVARFKGSGEVEVGVFLVDAFCLGVKDEYFTRLWPDEYEDRLLGGLDRQGGREAISPACARKLVEDAVAYARQFGIEPHPDFHRVKGIFAGIDSAAATRRFDFGDRNGKPHFIAGPNDGPFRCRQIMSLLRHYCGTDGFHFTVPIGGAVGLRDLEYVDDGEESDDDAEGRGDGPQALGHRPR